jgi:hypothetical protein
MIVLLDFSDDAILLSRVADAISGMLQIMSAYVSAREWSGFRHRMK